MAIVESKALSNIVFLNVLFGGYFMPRSIASSGSLGVDQLTVNSNFCSVRFTLIVIIRH
jgi:hypothetical protein